MAESACTDGGREGSVKEAREVAAKAAVEKTPTTKNHVVLKEQFGE